MIDALPISSVDQPQTPPQETYFKKLTKISYAHKFTEYVVKFFLFIGYIASVYFPISDLVTRCRKPKPCSTPTPRPTDIMAIRILACNILEMAYALREFREINDDEVASGFLTNKHADDLRYI